METWISILVGEQSGSDDEQEEKILKQSFLKSQPAQLLSQPPSLQPTRPSTQPPTPHSLVSNFHFSRSPSVLRQSSPPRQLLQVPTLFDQKSDSGNETKSVRNYGRMTRFDYDEMFCFKPFVRFAEIRS